MVGAMSDARQNGVALHNSASSKPFELSGRNKPWNRMMGAGASFPPTPPASVWPRSAGTAWSGATLRAAARHQEPLIFRSGIYPKVLADGNRARESRYTDMLWC